MKAATNPQASAELISCLSSEMQGERIVKVESGHPAHVQFNLMGVSSRNPYASLTYTMASGKVFVVTASSAEINCYRSSVDAEPVRDQLDPKKEQEWVSKVGTSHGVVMYIESDVDVRLTNSIDKAQGWKTKGSAEYATNEMFTGRSPIAMDLDPQVPGVPASYVTIARRRSFRDK